MIKKTLNNECLPSSFRDPSGFLFARDGLLLRQINFVYKENYDSLIESGLYKELVDGGLLISHQEVDIKNAFSSKAYKIIKPELINFISYPYEWCFSQLKHAALTTLKIQKIAFKFGMSLKDSSAYNIQFLKAKPVLIDTLSFEKYQEGNPWVAYRQFCQHFLAPLALMSHTNISLNQLLRIYIDGIPLDLASSLLPLRTRFSFSLASHIHLHAKSQKAFADKNTKARQYKMSKWGFLGLIDSLDSTIRKLEWKISNTEWGSYYDKTNYSPAALAHKQAIITGFLEKINPYQVWDLGANTGLFSRLASVKGIPTISFDSDPAAVEKSYRASLKENETNILALLIDLTNPSPGVGWQNQERASFLERGPTDTVFALALIHHLAISNNLPFCKIANFFSSLCKRLIIEFVPKNDSQIERLLATREDIFMDYTQPAFEEEFRKYFTIIDTVKINNSERTLYLMEAHKS